MSRTNLVHHESGAELVELALVLPLFVGLLFVCFDMARIANGYASVHSAAFRAARDAAALQRSEWNAITAINFSGSPVGNNVGNELDISGINDASFRAPEFRANVMAPPPSAPITDTRWYTCMMNRPDTTLTAPCVHSNPFPPDSLYRMEVRAIAYANQLMKENTGSNKYPCDANSPLAASNPTQDYAACFRCFTLRGDPNYNQYFSASGPNSKWFLKVLALRCEYDVPITSTSIALGWFPTHITVSSEMFVDIDFYGNSIFYPDP